MFKKVPYSTKFDKIREHSTRFGKNFKFCKIRQNSTILDKIQHYLVHCDCRIMLNYIADTEYSCTSSKIACKKLLC